MIPTKRVLSTEVKRRKNVTKEKQVNIFLPITPVILVKTKEICCKNNNTVHSILLLLCDQRIKIGTIKMSLEMNDWLR
jgi:hypothetical protein